MACGNIISDISDHFSQFCILKSIRDKIKMKKSKVRDFSRFSRDSFNGRHKDLATLTRMINQELSHVFSWFNANKLTVHPDKFKFIIFHPRRKQINPSELNILINNTPIARVQEHKFLGIIIHENLSWKPHIYHFNLR